MVGAYITCTPTTLVPTLTARFLQAKQTADHFGTNHYLGLCRALQRFTHAQVIRGQ